MRILIINEYASGNTNYGNCLQSYALSKYVANIDTRITVEVAHIVQSKSNFLRTKFYTLKDIMVKGANKIKKLRANNNTFPGKSGRINAVKNFIKYYIPISREAFDLQKLKESDYDMYIVGSDVVWAQRSYKFNRVKFLDFPKKQGLKISYAASFGRDWIPPENIKDIKRCLADFDFVSVRESSSIKMLGALGILAEHALDPTLLLGVDEWHKLELVPPQKCLNMINSERTKDRYEVMNIEFVSCRYVFVYILGGDKKLHSAIKTWAIRNELIVVTIPYASGEYNTIDSKFGDIQIPDCSPENWIWLIHHAEYVITDSFHGTAFSTIFEKKFVVLERKADVNINNRMIDYLKTIHQPDKMIPYSTLDSIANMEWDYNSINSILSEKRVSSEAFLRNALFDESV